jgi:hypothetical protein
MQEHRDVNGARRERELDNGAHFSVVDHLKLVVLEYTKELGLRRGRKIGYLSRNSVP